MVRGRGSTRTPEPSPGSPRRSVRLAGATCALLAATAACSASGPDPAVTSAATTTATNAPIRIDTRRLAPGLWPADVADTATERVGRLLFSGLVRYDAKGKAVEEVASSITTKDDRVYDVTLEPGWTFSNGEAVTAHSFVDAWNAAARRDTGAYRASALAPIVGYDGLHAPATTSRASATTDPSTATLAGLTVVDDQRFTITLEDPTPGFEDRLGDLAFSPLPAAALKDPQSFATAPIGNGPYQLAGPWNPDAPVDLRPRASYAGGDPARNAGLQLSPYADPDTAYADFQAGRLDVLDDVSPTHLAGYRTDFGTRALTQPIGAADSLVFPVNRDPWRGEPGRLRRLAISQAVDRQAITSQVYAGTRQSATDLAAPVVEGSSQDLCAEACRHDEDAARDTLAKAGGLSEPLRVAYAADAGAKPAVDVLCAQVSQALGVGCTASAYPTELALREAVSTGRERSAYLETWHMTRPALASFLVPRFTPGSPANGSGYANDVTQTKLSTAATAPLLGQPDAYRAVEADIIEALPVVPLWSLSATGAYGPGVQPVHVDAFGSLVYTQIARP